MSAAFGEKVIVKLPAPPSTGYGEPISRRPPLPAEIETGDVRDIIAARRLARTRLSCPGVAPTSAACTVNLRCRIGSRSA